MWEAVVLLLALAAAAYVVRPLAGGPVPEPAELPAEVAGAEERKRIALEAIVDLEDDHSTGKLSDHDLEDLRLRYEAEAIAAIKEADGVRGEDELEAEIARIRRGLRR